MSKLPFPILGIKIGGCGVIAVKIKNKISKEAKKSLERAIEHVYERRGAVYEQGDYIFVMLSPLMTRTYKNEVEAAKIAEKITLALKELEKAPPIGEEDCKLPTKKNPQQIK